ncbi:DUF2946 domain-containing protein [Pseudomonas putida]|uniref:DUF2946 domain-containing protein n=1 Tax=Pseudomonas putida group TaxID=136845 RepID=UPI001059E851|nr:MULTISPECIES: DUF2946 domain-containing protein [Pseudomonas putida group]MBF8745985.1 DUF2946 domain-containing protein [Pseudomonas monteilii]TDJ78576.1 DUF2946 domain-containing protein [Pseudomonas putida]
MSLPRQRSRHATRPERARTRGSWLSLFAMWMIFIGPLVSQSMPMQHHAGMNMPMDMSMPISMAMPHEHAADHHHGHGNDGQLHVMWEKCGYCSLLFNCPALPQTLSPLSAGSTEPCALRPTPALQGHARQAVFPGARSRAPPLSIVV